MDENLNKYKNSKDDLVEFFGTDDIDEINENYFNNIYDIEKN